MQYHEDLDGIEVDGEDLLENESATTGALAERLMDGSFEGFYSESRDRICYSSASDPKFGMDELEVHLHPNHSI